MSRHVAKRQKLNNAMLVPVIFSELNSIESLVIDDSTTDLSTLNSTLNSSLESTSQLSQLSTQLLELNLNNLNDYVLLEILNYLSINDLISVRLLNRRFYYLVENYLIFKLDQVMIHVSENYRGFDCCIEHKQTELNCIKQVENMDRFLNGFLIKLPRLKVLNLCLIKINENDLNGLTSLHAIGNTLEHLEISRCEFNNFYLSARSSYDEFFKKLGNKLKHFLFFKNKNYLIPSNFLFRCIKKYLKNLDTLVLDLRQFDNLKFTSETVSNNLAIKHLSLHGFLYPAHQSVDRLIIKLVLHSQIEFLNLECIKIEPTNLFTILSNCLNVKVLKFSYDFAGDNRFGRKLITSKCVFDPSHFRQMRFNLQEEGTTVSQFRLASKIVELKQLEELHLLEILSANVNIDPLILYLYHYYKRNNLHKLTIANYELHLLNLKAFCFVSGKLEVLSFNELNGCCYKAHRFKSSKCFRTLNDSSASVVGYT